MKRSFSKILFIVAIIGFSLPSCKKDEQLIPKNSGGSGTGSAQSPTTYNLVANQWQGSSEGTYYNDFKNLFIYSVNPRKIEVYLVENGSDIQINSFIPFMGGQLYAIASATDVQIVFRNGGSTVLPFNSLNVKVILE